MRVELAGAKVLVVGLGLSGLAAVRLLHRKGALVTATDVTSLDRIKDGTKTLSSLGVPFEPQSPAVFEGKDLVVLSPGVPADLPELSAARRRGVPVAGEVEVAGWFLQGPIIGITGSNGKTTTTALTGHILRESGIPVQVGGNIGRAPADMVGSSRAGQWNVLELSSFQLETINRFRAQIGAALNVTPDHLDRHHTMEAYVAAKGRLFEMQDPQDPAVLNADDPFCAVYGSRKRAVVWFSSTRRPSQGLWLDSGWIVFDGQHLIQTAGVPLRGRHNLENVMAAAAVSRLAGASLDSIAAAVQTFPGVEHRLEFVRSLAGVDYYNDSKATNVDAALKALEAFSAPMWVILGGKDKGSDYRPLRDLLAHRARAALLIGAAAAKIGSHLEGAVDLVECGTIEAAVTEARRRAEPGEIVLLAPACASFDQFDNYEHRGRVFKSLVASLEEDSCD